MKKLFLAASVLLATVVTANAQNDFRNFAWGSPINQVESSEKSKLIVKVKDDELEYEEQLAGSDCNVYYIFNDNDKLVSGLYFFTKVYDNPQLYLQDYNKFKTLLEQKYGKPTSDNQIWNHNTPPMEKHNYGQAIADGDLALNSVWETANSNIKIKLVSLDKHPSLQIIYTTRTLDEMENKDALKKALDKL
jgi:hypothetical protein